MPTSTPQPTLGLDIAPGQTLRFRYTNWQGIVAIRHVQPLRMTYGSTEWHPEPQWLLEAIDLEKSTVRLFAIQDMSPATDATKSSIVITSFP